MSNYSKFVWVTLAIILAGFLVLQGVDEKEEVSNLGGGFSLSKCQTSASTTVNSDFIWLVAGATTTLNCFIASADMIDFNLFYVSSSTASAPLWNYQFSSDHGDWYGESAQSNTNNLITYGRYGVNHTFLPATTTNATTTRNFQITPLASNWLRINLGTLGADAKVRLEVIKKELINGR